MRTIDCEIRQEAPLKVPEEGEILTGPGGRPMQMSVSYFGVLPVEAREAIAARLARFEVTETEIRNRSISTDPQIVRPFDVCVQGCLAYLRDALFQLGVGREVYKEIRTIILEGGCAPKFCRTLDGQFSVAVNYADLDPNATYSSQVRGDSKPTSSGFGWCRS